MGFFDLFKSKSQRAKLSHLKSLIAVMVADGKIQETEIASIATVLAREGLTPDDFNRIMANPNSVKFVMPRTEQDKVKYLRDMVALMIVDGDIDEREMKICLATAVAYGYRPEIVPALLHDIIERVKMDLGI